MYLFLLALLSAFDSIATPHEPPTKLVCYRDQDRDGWGDSSSTRSSTKCSGTWTETPGDCDDTVAATHPGADEVCDGLDNDCSGVVDDGDAGTATWYADTDGDGYGDATASLVTCADPGPGWVLDAADCDDTASGTNPAAIEICDGVDDDCNGLMDDAAVDASTWYADADLDGFGDAAVVVAACDEPVGNWATAADDCDDTTAAVHPGAVDVCDDLDNDCDGIADGDPASWTAWYNDGDRDGVGDFLVGTHCSAVEGAVAETGDCDDFDADVHPGAVEVCNGKDDDCDGTSDVGATDEATLYADADLDAHGAGDSLGTGCASPGTATTADDCDDADATVYPGAVDVCDAKDNDCDGSPDEDGGGWLDDGVTITDLSETLQAWTPEAPGWLEFADADLHLCAGTYTGTIVMTGDAAVDGDPGAVIDAGGANAALIAYEGSFSVSGLTLTGGNVYGGGGLRCLRGDVAVSDAVITGNTATDGGGLYGALCDFTVTDSTVSDNVATGLGGGIYTSGTLDLVRTTVSGNDGGSGGGVYLDGSVGSCADGTFSGNDADWGDQVGLDEADFDFSHCDLGKELSVDDGYDEDIATWDGATNRRYAGSTDATTACSGGVCGTTEVLDTSDASWMEWQVTIMTGGDRKYFMTHLNIGSVSLPRPDQPAWTLEGVYWMVRLASASGSCTATPEVRRNGVVFATGGTFPVAYASTNVWIDGLNLLVPNDTGGHGSFVGADVAVALVVTCADPDTAVEIYTGEDKTNSPLGATSEYFFPTEIAYTMF